MTIRNGNGKAGVLMALPGANLPAPVSLLILEPPVLPPAGSLNVAQLALEGVSNQQVQLSNTASKVIQEQ